ncbi:MAG: FapA family protein [candidate division KSB1 bacterium]|nr:FapA family protein [candidate division KSB1 bacterium]MDQ7064699.1 FapA family protein [candidate division KSB1 bacterium]
MRLVTQDNGLRAYMLLGKKDMGKEIDTQTVKTILQRSGITYGISLENWEPMFKRFAKGQLPRNSILVARGREPVPGAPGRVEYLFPLKRKFPIQNHEQDFLDAILLRVKKGQPVLRVHPPGKGKPGITVKGEPIPAPRMESPPLPELKNVIRHAQDPFLYVAGLNGAITFSNEKELAIWPLEEIPRSISSAMGEIKVEHSLLVHGDIKSGSSVHAKGSVFVMGVVEDAKIIAGGDVYVLKGFIGRGKGIIQAGNDVYVHYVDNQTIQASNNIYIHDEAMKCNLVAGRAVVFAGKKSCLIGGTVCIGQSIRVYRAGNEKNIRTVINIDPNQELVQRLSTKQKELARLEEQLNAVKDRIFQFVRSKANYQSRSLKYDELLKNLLKTKENYIRTIEQFRQEITSLNERLSRLRAGIRVEISGPIYPGVIIRYGGRTYQVFRPTYNVVLTYDDF